ncbi:MAG: hypothetical protein ABFQ62_05460, partial [Patescibacteria group bacterium]
NSMAKHHLKLLKNQTPIYQAFSKEKVTVFERCAKMVTLRKLFYNSFQQKLIDLGYLIKNFEMQPLVLNIASA